MRDGNAELQLRGRDREVAARFVEAAANNRQPLSLLPGPLQLSPQASILVISDPNFEVLHG